MKKFDAVLLYITVQKEEALFTVLAYWGRGGEVPVGGPPSIHLKKPCKMDNSFMWRLTDINLTRDRNCKLFLCIFLAFVNCCRLHSVSTE